MISGSVTSKGTLEFAKNSGVLESNFNTFENLTLSNVGMGTYLGDADNRTDEMVKNAVKQSIQSGINVIGTAINYSDNTASPFSFIDRTSTVTEDMLLDTSSAGASESIIVSVSPNIEVNTGAAVTVGAGKTMIIDVLQIGDL